MAFKRVTEKFDNLAGFWDRSGTLQGFLMGRVKRQVKVGKKVEERAFFVIKLTEPSQGTTKESQEIVEFEAGEVVGTSASAVLDKAFDGVKDKVEVKVTNRQAGGGTRPLANGQSVWDFEVEIDEESVYVAPKDDDSDVPF